MKPAASRSALIASMVIFGTIGIFRRSIPLPSALIAMSRGYVGGLFLLLVMLLRRKPFSPAAIRRNLPLLVLSGGAMGFNWILLFEAYNYTSVATATLCYYMAPIFLILASPFVLKERLTPRKLGCVAAALAGMVLISGVGDLSGSEAWKGILFGLGAAVLYASVVLMNKCMSPIPAYDKTILQLLSAAVVLNLYNGATGALAAFSFTPLSALMLSIVCILHTGIAYALYFGSMDALPAQTLALFSYIDPVVAVLLSALLLHEPMSPLALLGAALVLGSAMVSELWPS